MTTFRVSYGLATALLALELLACNQAKPGAATDKGASEQDSKAASKGDKTAAATGEPCTDYASQLCEKAGETSPTCQAAKKTTALMPAAACKVGLGDMAFTEAKLKEQGKSCDELRTKLCKDIGEDTQSCQMVKEQTPNFPPERCVAMLEQYDKVLADLKKREEANKPLDPEKRASIEKGAVAAFGPETAKVTVVEFSDFQCPFCSRAANAVGEIKKKYKDKDVRFIFRQFPLSFHKQAHLAAQASLAAAEQGKFWEYHDTLFDKQKELERDKLEEHAKSVGLDMAKFKQALDGETFKKAVDDDLALGKDVNVTGTPTMFVNGTRVANPTDTAAISTVIDKELAK